MECVRRAAQVSNYMTSLYILSDKHHVHGRIFDTAMELVKNFHVCDRIWMSIAKESC